MCCITLTIAVLVVRTCLAGAGVAKAVAMTAAI